MDKRVCPGSRVLNPKTNRCVKKSGTTAKAFLPKEKKVCPKNKVLNTATNRCVKIDGVVAKAFLPKHKKICRESRVLNPKTNRCVKLNGVVAKLLKLRKSSSHHLHEASTVMRNSSSHRSRPISLFVKKSSPHKSHQAITVPKKSSPHKSSPHKSSSHKSRHVVKKSSTSRQRRIDAFIKKVAAKKIQKLTMPFIKRVSIDIEDRIKTYILYAKYLSQYNSEQCLKVISKKGKKTEYSIADNNIKIVKQIGTESKYGAIYLSKGSNVGELFRFASKIMTQNSDNFKEIKILSRVTDMVINKKNPHFPIMYYNFACTLPNNSTKLPKFAQKKRYFVNLNELANGDLKMFMHKEYSNFKAVNNALAQIYLAILSFHSLGYSHNDAHWGNFLYHKINPGGYIKYNINGREVYLENVGYLWVIWDYGFATQLYKDSIQDTIKDYTRVVRAFINESSGWLPINYPLKDETINLVNNIKYQFNTSYLWGSTRRTTSNDSILITKLIDNTNLYIKSANLPANSKIINNNNPYVINI